MSDGGGSCSTTVSCPTGSSCYFAIGTCSTTGKCFENPAPGTPVCKVIVDLCGCDGQIVTSGCAYPTGYASAPTLGAHLCSDGGAEAGKPDGGF